MDDADWRIQNDFHSRVAPGWIAAASSTEAEKIAVLHTLPGCAGAPDEVAAAILLPSLARTFLHHRTSPGGRWRQYPSGKQRFLKFPFTLAGISALTQTDSLSRIQRFLMDR
jgi:hypothetical protein